MPIPAALIIPTVQYTNPPPLPPQTQCLSLLLSSYLQYNILTPPPPPPPTDTMPIPAALIIPTVQPTKGSPFPDSNQEPLGSPQQQLPTDTPAGDMDS